MDELPCERTLVFAPHPDDESVGAGGLLAHIAGRGATVHVVFLTSGENNPWPQRASTRRWRVTAADRQDWGRTRRSEARRALLDLGIPPQNATFLGFPDDGLSRVDRTTLIQAVAKALSDFNPTLLVVPSIDDLHPDHRAAYRAIIEAVAVSACTPLLILSYVIHGDLASPERRVIAMSDEERARKREAIGRHATQLLLSRRRFLRYAARDEQYGVVTDLSFREERWFSRWIAKVRHVLSLL
jgi:LmbE family N-acetylglucosaminyl deacetylase